MGIKEAAELIGWSRQKTSVYYRRGLLPPPAAELACGPVWMREDMVHFAEREKELKAQKPDPPRPAAPRRCIYRASIPLAIWPEPPTVYWTSDGQYILHDGWRNVVSTHRLGYYRACLQKGIISPSRSVVDVDGLVQAWIGKGRGGGGEEVKGPTDVRHPEVLRVMRRLGWFDEAQPGEGSRNEP